MLRASTVIELGLLTLMSDRLRGRRFGTWHGCTAAGALVAGVGALVLSRVDANPRHARVCRMPCRTRAFFCVRRRQGSSKPTRESQPEVFQLLGEEHGSRWAVRTYAPESLRASMHGCGTGGGYQEEMDVVVVGSVLQRVMSVALPLGCCLAHLPTVSTERAIGGALIPAVGLWVFARPSLGLEHLIRSRGALTGDRRKSQGTKAFRATRLVAASDRVLRSSRLGVTPGKAGRNATRQPCGW
jgi:hypothetical protein